MKFIIALSFLISTVAALNFGGTQQGPKICVINVPNCNANLPVCARYGRSNLCTRFANQCALEMMKCQWGNTAYTAVNINRCVGIPLNQRRQCAGTSTNGNGVLSSLLGGSTSTSNVQPIIINTGK